MSPPPPQTVTVFSCLSFRPLTVNMLFCFDHLYDTRREAQDQMSQEFTFRTLCSHFGASPHSSVQVSRNSAENRILLGFKCGPALSLHSINSTLIQLVLCSSSRRPSAQQLWSKLSRNSPPTSPLKSAETVMCLFCF